MAFEVSQDTDGQGQESGEPRFYPAAQRVFNHRPQCFVVEEHGAGGPADHGGTGVHEEGEAVQHFSYELASHDDDGDAYHEAEYHQQEVAVGRAGYGEDVVNGHKEICQDNSFDGTPEVIGSFNVRVFISRRHQMDGNGDKEDAAKHLEIGNGKEPYGHEG